MQKRIGLLTSGGDCPGLNAVIRAVVSHATLTYGWKVLGIPYATEGLMERKSIVLGMHTMDLRGIDPLLNMGGTILGTINRGDTLDHASQIIQGYHELGLDALIAVGGDGSLSILHTLAQEGNWLMVGIPKTIDNDVALTERAIGFDTAVNTITDALNRLTFTAASHDRVMIVEVMGRKAGHLALQAGIAGGADVILIPEIPYTIEGICDHLTDLRYQWGRKFAIVVVAEGIDPLPGTTGCQVSLSKGNANCGMGQYIADQITARTDRRVETRVSVLGHIQRGGIPFALDRLMAAAFGKAAVDLVSQGKSGLMVAWQNGTIVSVPLTEVLAQSPRSVNPKDYLVQTAQSLGIYIGEPNAAQPAEPG
ncbi:6-phosphofructokinase [Leptolyngbya sp. 'hensonii']|uniref:ATP-dependent 6-phosphofructokinase n=1 Tax=Leptolyngbya sp. 'hensonii' TaxID=1922337 RepID=UPI00094FF29C|nr:6-phosphofructokinase [Leptolyngbya sp. 'hensonii']